VRGKICYLGDDHLQGAAGYLAAILMHHGLAFDYVPSAESPPPDFTAKAFEAYVISDYPSPRLGHAAMSHIATRVEQGAGLVMIGGWESFHGLLGEYDESPLAAVLPVVMQSCDDRRSFAQPCLIEKVADHEILAGLPWEQPPGIGGINVLTAKPDSETLLSTVPFSVRRTAETYEFTALSRAPLLVVGQHGAGRTAALATDVAPHWVGGFVDWGDRRIVQGDFGGGTIEVGNWYARFFRNLVAWAGHFDDLGNAVARPNDS
jgi:hypothetical protein